MPRNYNRIILLLILLVTIGQATDFYIDGTFFDTINSPSIRLDDMHFNVSARVVLADPVHGCGKLKNPDSELQGSILMTTSDTGVVACRMYERMQKAAKAGCVGLIFENKILGGGAGLAAYYINWDVQRHHLTIPAVEIPKSGDLIKKLKDPSVVVTAVMVNGNNEITDTWRAWVAYSTIMGTWALGTVLLSGYKLKLFIERYKLRVDVPQSALFMLCLSGIFRVISMVDPPYTRGLYPWFVTGIFDLLTFPLVLCSALLMAFYWEDAMRSASVHSIPTLKKMKKPFYISAIILMILASITVLLRGLNTVLNIQDLISIIINLVFCIFILGFYSYEAYQVLSKLYRSTSVTKKQSSLYQMTLLLIGAGFFILTYILFLLLLAGLPYTTPRFITMRFGLTGSVNGVSTCLILAFRNPRGDVSTTSGSSSNRSSAIKQTSGATKDMDVEMEGNSESPTGPSIEVVV